MTCCTSLSSFGIFVTNVLAPSKSPAASRTWYILPNTINHSNQLHSFEHFAKFKTLLCKQIDLIYCFFWFVPTYYEYKRAIFAKRRTREACLRKLRTLQGSAADWYSFHTNKPLSMSFALTQACKRKSRHFLEGANSSSSFIYLSKSIPSFISVGSVSAIAQNTWPKNSKSLRGLKYSRQIQ